MTIRLRRILPIAAAAFALFAVGGQAAASAGTSTTVRLDGVSTSLTTDTATTGVLVSHGVLPLPVGRATVTPVVSHGIALRYRFPITGGVVDATTLAGYIKHSGGLRFLNLVNGKTLTLTNFKILIGAHPGLTAAVNGDRSVRVRILNLDLSGATVDKDVPWVTVSNVKATLTKTAADALNASLGVGFFARGITLGTAQVHAHIA
jgi:Htaa